MPIRGNMGFPGVAKQMRRLSGQCGGAARQDVLVASEFAASSEESSDFAAWVKRRKAKRRGEIRGGRLATRKKKQDRITGGDRTLNGFNTRAGIRIRCGTCNSDFCRAPNCPYRGNSVKNKPRRPHSSLSTESPVSVKGDRAPLTEGKKGQLSTALFNHSGYARPVCLHG